MTDAAPRSASTNAIMLVYATRYALGRRSSAASDVEQAISANLGVLRHDRGCLQAIIRDIRGATDYGADCDRECWMRTLGRCEAALSSRNDEPIRVVPCLTEQP
jgi:hypothetical protein